MPDWFFSNNQFTFRKLNPTVSYSRLKDSTPHTSTLKQPPARRRDGLCSTSVGLRLVYHIAHSRWSSRSIGDDCGTLSIARVLWRLTIFFSGSRRSRHWHWTWDAAGLTTVISAWKSDNSVIISSPTPTDSHTVSLFQTFLSRERFGRLFQIIPHYLSFDSRMKYDHSRTMLLFQQNDSSGFQLTYH